MTPVEQQAMLEAHWPSTAEWCPTEADLHRMWWVDPLPMPTEHVVIATTTRPPESISTSDALNALGLTLGQLSQLAANRQNQQMANQGLSQSGAGLTGQQASLSSSALMRLLNHERNR